MKDWFKNLVVYQIWPRSFCDGNGDGIGDLQGVLSKMDYLESLGINCIWFSPLYPSPNADFGYDIADYRNISPEYGNMDLFKQVLDEAHARGMKVIMDLVVNHTSDEHEWFQKSKDLSSPYHDYYFWRKGRGKRPPNNWLSCFEGGAWEYEKDIDEYYLHVFAKKQPDLNHDNPNVRREVKDILRFWLDLGVDGFREDVITFISKKEGLPNGFPIPTACGIEHYMDGPHVHEYLREYREVTDQYDCFTVGEAPMMTPGNALKYIGGENRELDLMFHFQHMDADCILMDYLQTKFNLKKMKHAFSRWQEKLNGKAWNTLYIENHDHPRIISRYGSEKYRVESGKMLANMYMLQQGTPFIYQGQEIGMENMEFTSMDQIDDISTIDEYQVALRAGCSEKEALDAASAFSRDNARTPVQWSAEKNAGFSEGEPWLGVNPNYKEINIESQLTDSNSLLSFYKKLTALRKAPEYKETLVYGTFAPYQEEQKNLIAYTRNGEKNLLILGNMQAQSQKVSLPGEVKEVLLNNQKAVEITEKEIILKPYQFIVLETAV